MTVTPDDYYKITRINHLNSHGQYLIWDQKSQIEPIMNINPHFFSIIQLQKLNENLHQEIN